MTTSNSGFPWIASLTDPAIEAEVASLTASGTLSYSGALQILDDVEASVSASPSRAVTASEFDDLQTIAANLNNGITTSAYVTSIFTQLVDGSPANAEWTGGAKSTSWDGTVESTALGDLAIGTTSTNVSELIGKWFLGTDLPSATGEGDTSKQSINPTYKAYTLPLFEASGVPEAADVVQGDTGDCELCAGMIEMAINHPSTIESMFVSDGNGTYGVRFTVGGEAIWVTVNDELPVYNGTLFYNDGAVMWANLLEKAYAQLSSTGLIDQAPVNSYSNISGDYAYEVLQNFSNAPEVQYYYSSSKDWAGYKDLIISAIASGDDLILESNGTTYDGTNMELVSDHAFAVIGYDSTTGDFIVRNPWGDEGAGQDYITQFEVSMADIAGVQGDIVIDNSANPNVLITTLGQVTTLGQNNTYDQFIATGQYVSVGSSVPVSTLFTTIDTAGLAITEYMFQAIGTGAVTLNGASDLASAAQQAQGQIVIAAGDLGKLTFTAGTSTGDSDLLVSAYDGVSWSMTTDIALTVTSLPAAVTPILTAVVAPSATLNLSSLFTVSGIAGDTGVYYGFAIEGDAGGIALNGATNLLSHPAAGEVDVSAAQLGDLSYTAPSVSPAANDGQVYIDVTVYDTGGALSNVIQLPINVGVDVASAIQSFDANEISYWIAITDTAAEVFANLDTLQSMLSVGDIGWIALTNTSVAAETITTTQLANDRGVLSMLSGDLALTVTDESAAGAAAAAQTAHVVAVSVTDSAADVIASLESLESLAAAGTLSGITLTDGGTPTLVLSPAQQASDESALAAINSPYTLEISGTDLNTTQTTINDFNDILFDSGRAANQPLITQYASDLSGGSSSLAQIAAAIAILPEASIVDYVYSLYSAILDVPLSNGSASGLEYWVHQAEAMLTPGEITAGQLTTPVILFLDQSFINAAGSNGTPTLDAPIGTPTIASAAALVDQLYAQGLGNTAPAAGGVTYWVDQYMAQYAASGATPALQFLVNSFANAAAVVDAHSIITWLSSAAVSDTGGGASYGSAIYRLEGDGQASITEGVTETFAFTSVGVAANTTLSYQLSGVTAAEVVGGQLTGTLTVGSAGSASLAVTLTSTPGQGLGNDLTATIGLGASGSIVAAASEPLTETAAHTGSVALVGVSSAHADLVDGS